MKLRFGDFRLDVAARQLFHGDREIHVSPKAFDLLIALIESRRNVVRKTDLQNRLWPSTFVSEANLPGLVSELRSALEDQPSPPTFMTTGHCKPPSISVFVLRGFKVRKHAGESPAKSSRSPGNSLGFERDNYETRLQRILKLGLRWQPESVA